MAHHDLKIHEQPFNDLLSGAKTCEVRNNDRGFQVGDTVQLHEIADTFTGRVMVRKITHVQTGYGLPDGLCVLSYAQLPSQWGEAVAWLTSDKRHLVFSGALDQSQYVEQGMTPLYTHPADQVADDLTMVKVPRELLERAVKTIERHWPNSIALRELRALLAKGEGGEAMTEPAKRYNMDVGKFGIVDAYESEHGQWVKCYDYARLEQECERLRDLLTAWRRMFDGGIESGDLGVLRGQTDAALSAKP